MTSSKLKGTVNPVFIPDMEDRKIDTAVTIHDDVWNDNCCHSPDNAMDTPAKYPTPTSDIFICRGDKNKVKSTKTNITITPQTENALKVYLESGKEIVKEDDRSQVAQVVRNTSNYLDANVNVTTSVEEDKKKQEVTMTKSSPDISSRQTENTSKGDITDGDMEWFMEVERQFKRLACGDDKIRLGKFREVLGLRKSFFAGRFFHIFDKDKSGCIGMNQLVDGLRVLTKGSPMLKLQILFNVFDVDGSGTIDMEELRTVLKSCMEESSLSLTEENLDKLTEVLFESADEDGSGTITFEELKAELEKHPGLLDNLTISIAQWIKPPEKSEEKKNGVCRYFKWSYIRNNLRKIIFFFWFVLMNIGLFILNAYTYWASNGCIIVARGAGMCLNFTCMFVIVLILRKCLTFLRLTIIANVLPLDQNILFHKMCGFFIVFWTVIHTVCHIGNAVIVSEATGLGLANILFTTAAGVGFVGASAFITGWLLDLILIVMVICSMPFVRRTGHFQVFYWSHILYVPFCILVILHGPSFWKWFLAPGVIFVFEKISRSKFIKKARYGKTYIKEVNLLPSKVTHLVISRPPNFNFQPGDYVFLQIPAIAIHEWHPFSISSAPEMKEHIWLHVRSAGHWTNKLYEYFEAIETMLSSPDSVYQTHSTKRDENQKMDTLKEGTNRKSTARLSERKRLEKKMCHVKCFIDGPYGTGCREVFDTEHAVLIGAGIGVTPMASILQSIWYKYKKEKQSCPMCQHKWYGQVPESLMKLNKVDFIWINRDQRCFEWFVSLLTKLELEQFEDHEGSFEHFIQMRMYMTSAAKKTDMKGIGLQMALELMHKKEKKDMITGLKTKTEAGRPDWNKVFKEIKDEKKGKVKVFYCGAPALGKIIKNMCAKFNFGFSKENF